MKRTIKHQAQHLLVAAALLFGGIGSSVLLVSQPVMAADPPTATSSAATSVTDGVKAVGGTGTGTELTNLIKTIIDVLLFIVGAVAVIMIIIGGIRYVTSNGEQANVKGAKDTILYAVVGLIVAILAYAIVGFVVTNVK